MSKRRVAIAFANEDGQVAPPIRGDCPAAAFARLWVVYLQVCLWTRVHHGNLNGFGA